MESSSSSKDSVGMVGSSALITGICKTAFEDVPIFDPSSEVVLDDDLSEADRRVGGDERTFQKIRPLQIESKQQTYNLFHRNQP